MNIDYLLTGISEFVTAEGHGIRRGRAMRQLKLIRHAAIAVGAGRILWAGEEQAWRGDARETLDLKNRAVVPALVDPHTHAVWAGDRLADFEARTSGRTYEQILASGGGIRSTIRATAAASKQQLVALAKPRIASLLQSGASVIEIKSGYGFTAAAEIAMLEAIAELAAETRAQLIPTLLIHIPAADPAERSNYLAKVCATLIPSVATRALASAVDVFVEKEAWHPDEAEQILRCAQLHGLRTKLHTDQFHSIGGLELGLRMGVLSVDHLEACRPEHWTALAKSSTIATILPGVSLHLGIPAAPGRQLIDAGAGVAVGTDLNPGSSPLFSTAAALGLAVRLNGLTVQEALVAGTVNAACALGLDDVGRVEAGARADFLVLESSDWRDLIYSMGANVVGEVWIRGERVV